MATKNGKKGSWKIVETTLNAGSGPSIRISEEGKMLRARYSDLAGAQVHRFDRLVRAHGAGIPCWGHVVRVWVPAGGLQ